MTSSPSKRGLTSYISTVSNFLLYLKYTFTHMLCKTNVELSNRFNRSRKY